MGFQLQKVKKVKPQKWCQNGSKAIIYEVEIFQKNQIYYYIFDSKKIKKVDIMCAYMPRSWGVYLRKMPPSAGIYVHICPQVRAYTYIYAPGCTYISPGFGAISNSIARKCGNSFFLWALLQGYFGPKNRLCIYTPKKDIYIYIYIYIIYYI